MKQRKNKTYYTVNCLNFVWIILYRSQTLVLKCKGVYLVNKIYNATLRIFQTYVIPVNNVIFF